MNTHLVFGLASVVVAIYCFVSWRKNKDRDFFWFMWLGILGILAEIVNALLPNSKFPILLIVGPLIVMLAA